MATMMTQLCQSPVTPRDKRRDQQDRDERLEEAPYDSGQEAGARRLAGVGALPGESVRRFGGREPLGRGIERLEGFPEIAVPEGGTWPSSLRLPDESVGHAKLTRTPPALRRKRP